MSDTSASGNAGSADAFPFSIVARPRSSATWIRRDSRYLTWAFVRLPSEEVKTQAVVQKSFSRTCILSRSRTSSASPM